MLLIARLLPKKCETGNFNFAGTAYCVTITLIGSITKG